MAHSPGKRVFPHFVFLALLAACSWADECSTGSCPSAANSKALLQVSSQNAMKTEKSSDVEKICVVQDGQCFDMDLDPTWNDAELFQDTLSSTESMEKAFEHAVDSMIHPSSSYDSDRVQLVITRSGEDLRWLNALPQLPTIVYNRGGPDSTLPKSRPNLNIAVQENKGREDQVMLKHIVNNYDNLPEVTIFLQGWPFGHCPGLLQATRRAVSALLDDAKLAMLQGSAGSREGLMPMSGTFWQYNVSAGKVGLAKAIAKEHHLSDADAAEFAKDLFNSTCSKLLGGKPCPSLQWTAEGAQWAVGRNRLRSTPKEVYAQGLSLGEGWESKFRGLVLESLWPTLWGAENWAPDKVEFVSQIGDASSRARSSDGHCLPEWGKRTLLFSCEERMELCERRHRDYGINSKTFNDQRKRFQIFDANSDGSWHEMAQLVPVLWGAGTWVPKPAPGVTADETSAKRFLPALMENEGGEVQLIPEDTDLQEAAPATWRITASGLGRKFSRTSSEGQLRYLGCSDTARAKMLETETTWRLLSQMDGWVALATNKDGNRKFLALNDSDRQGHLWCLDSQDVPGFHSATFIINLLRNLGHDGNEM